MDFSASPVTLTFQGYHMKKTFLQQNTRSATHKKGSALLLTLLIVSLLMVIVLSFVVMIRLELKQMDNRVARFLDQSNAMVAVEIAIANLQRSAGIDQAVTANAELLKPDSATTAFKQKWVGVWRNDGVAFDPLDPVPAFDTWLVSGMDALSDPTIRETAYQNFSVQTGAGGALANTLNQVVMLGSGSVANAADQVAAPRVAFTQNLRTQSYAYWISDESQKVMLSLPAEDPNNMDAARKRARNSAPAQPRFGDMTDMGPALDALTAADLKQTSRLIFPNDTGLLSANVRTAMRRQFHDLTLNSYGLFTNPVDGGLKKDFSYAFEMSEASFRKSEFALNLGNEPLEYVTDNNGKSVQTKPIFNFQAKNAGGSLAADWDASDVYRGPTFDLIRDHYRLYQEVTTPFSKPTISSRAYAPNVYNGKGSTIYKYVTAPELLSGTFENAGNGAGDPTVTDIVSGRARSNAGGGLQRPRFTNTEIAPEVVRFLNLYSVTVNNERASTDPINPGGQEGDLTLVMEPIIYLHNPYNVAIEFDAVRMMYFRIDFGLYAYRMREADGWPINGKLTASINSKSHVGGYVRREVQALGGYTPDEVRDDNEFNLDIVITKNGLPATDPIVMLPGEVKVFTSNAARAESIGRDYRVVLTESVTDQAFSGGLTMSHLAGSLGDPKPYVVQSNEWIGVQFDYFGGPHGQTRGYQPGAGSMGPQEYSFLTTYLLETADTNPLPVGEVSESPGLRHYMMWPNAFLSGHNGGDDPIEVITIPFANISGPDDDPEKHYIGYTDFYMKPSKGEHYETEMLTHHATRAISLNPETGGAVGKNGSRIAQTWGLSMATRDEVDSGIEPRNRLAFGADGKGYWGKSLQAADGNKNVILYDVPTTPITSMAELQHLNQQIQFWEPSYAVGNSLASPYIPRDQIWNQSANPNLNMKQFDVSYLMNEALWDRYFFSSISKPATSSGYQSSLDMASAIADWEDQPLNPRVIPIGGASQAERLQALDETLYGSTQTSTDQNLPHNRVAEFYALAGMFNVNSVSVEAWKALLGSLNVGGFSITDDKGDVINLTVDDALRYFPRTALQHGGDSDQSDDRWDGQAHLTQAQLEVLAENIVDEIKTRSRNRGAPYASLSHFVNRELTTGSRGLSGPLQAAIDKGISGTNFNLDLLNAEGAAAKIDDSDHTNVYNLRVADPPNLATTFKGGVQVDSTFQDYPAPEHFRYSSAAGISQYLSQADLLSVIGSQLTVRADTFTIRAYGSSSNPGTGNPNAGVWCEVIVQRLPDYVNAESDPAYIHPDNLSNTINQIFGRRFKILQVRWLNDDEI